MLDRSRTINSFCEADELRTLCVLCLYSGEMQYGILVIDTEPREIALSYLMSIQIANALHYYEAYRTQQEMRNTLERLVT